MPRNFARGEPPPSHSIEWVGLAKPPTPAEIDNARKIEAARARQKQPQQRQQPTQMYVRSDSLTLVEIKPRRRIWPWALGAGAVGYHWGRARSH